MALILEQINAAGLAQLSYLVGDDTAGLVAVIDPRRDVDVYLEMARARGARISHIIETHIHADFVSGSHELQARTGAPIYGGASTDYRFELKQLHDGDEISIGSVMLRTIHTPGHTPEHVSFLLFDRQQGEEPFALFSGDTLFNLDVGRPDLLGGGTEQRLARQLYHTIFTKIIPLDDRIEVFPDHGAGSACGKSIGDRLQTTIGNEKLFSPALQERSETEFVEWILQGMPEPPRYYARLKQVNACGAPLRGGLPVIPPLSLSEFQQQMQDPQTMLIDTRSILAFGGGHIPGAINIALRSEFPTWIGWMVEPEQRLLLVVESERDIHPIAEHLYRIGYDNIGGYLVDGMTTWQNAALPIEHIPQWTVHSLNRHKTDGNLTILDVRTEKEWQSGHVPGATHLYVPHIPEQIDQFNRDQPIVTYCGTGYRASIAASLLKKQGFRSVTNVPGSWTAWAAAKLPVEGSSD